MKIVHQSTGCVRPAIIDFMRNKSDLNIRLAAIIIMTTIDQNLLTLLNTIDAMILAHARSFSNQ